MDESAKIISGDTSLHFTAFPVRGFPLRAFTTGLRLALGDAYFALPNPLQLEVVDAGGAVRTLADGYSRVTVSGPRWVRGEGELVSANGTRFLFSDTYTPEAGGFQVERRVEIASPHPADVGFSSSFGLAWVTPATARTCDILMPGVWYRDNRAVPPRAFGADPDAQVQFCREDRLGLPLVAARERQSGVSVLVERVGGVPGTVLNERGRGVRLIDGRFQVGALGIWNAGKLTLGFTFPGTEDERPLLGADTPHGPRYAPVSHPVRVGVAHAYTLFFRAARTPDFASLVESAVKGAIERAKPPRKRADVNRVYRASLDLLDAVVQPHNGTTGVPFQVLVPGGEVKDTSSQMGFVGMALPCAALLLQDGLETGNRSAVERATAVIAFWVRESPEPSGVPKNWCDFPAPGKVTWRGYPTHLRVASDGMRGVLRAWGVARRHRREPPEWLAFARTFGDFLVQNQNADGSWFGSWNRDGTPHERYTNASLHSVPFLVDLARATGDRKYAESAARAGSYSWPTVHEAYAYVGGTPDNPNVTDKEAGMVAVDAFLALFDATGEPKWRDAARQAALFCETWVYWRDLPMPDAPDPKRVFPSGAWRTTVGLSLIATGHSGADNFMALGPFWWYRLYLATEDSHFLQTARLLLHETKQIMDWDGALHYRYAGLMPEAMNLASERGRGVAGWLPWLTFVVVDPLVRLRDTFGTWDIDEIEKRPLAERRERNARFGKTRGF